VVPGFGRFLNQPPEEQQHMMNFPLRVLIVEDSATDARLVVQELQRTGHPLEFERVETAGDMRAALDRPTWDAVIADWTMPRFTASEALAILKEKGLDLPFIIVSGTIGEETAVEAMRAGAHDYVLKDRLRRLMPAVEREVRECNDRRARRQAEAAFRESEARFRRLTESGIIGITVSNVNGDILDANDTYVKMVGYSREELLRGGLRWVDLTPPECGQLIARSAEQLCTSGVAPPWETELLKKDGGRVPIVVGMALLEYPKCIAFVADLTGRRQAESARSRAEAALRHSEEQVRWAQKMYAAGSNMERSELFRNEMEELHTTAARSMELARQLRSVSRQQVAEPIVSELHDVLARMDEMIQRILKT
jgi:two-component system cell cycle sensor histidine kinase/response regulator CckA